MNNHSARLRMLVIAGELLLIPWAAVGAEMLVGNKGNAKEFHLTGNTQIRTESVRMALLRTPNVIIAGHPLAPMKEFIESVREHVISGYRNSGFPASEVEVIAGGERDPLSIRIVEGPRCIAGPIEVRGAKLVATNDIVKRLSEQFPPAAELRTDTQSTGYLDAMGKPVELQEPLWEFGKPAHFGTEGAIQLRVLATLQDLGFIRARAEIEIIPDESRKLARLAVKIIDEGQPAKLVRIEVGGNSVNSREEILAYASLKVGDRVDQQLARRVLSKLYLSGRFRSIDLALEPDPDGNGILKLNLVEEDRVSRLKDPLTRSEQAMINLRDWLDSMRVHGEAVEAEVQAGEIGVYGLVSPRNGLFVQPKGGTKEKAVALPAVYVSSNAAGIFFPARKEKYFVRNPQATVSAFLRMEPPEDAEHRGRMEVGGGIGKKLSSSEAGYKFDLDFAPAPFLLMARNTNYTDSFRDGIFEHALGTNVVLRTEEKTGKLLYARNADGAPFAFRRADSAKLVAFLGEAESWKNLYASETAASGFMSAMSRAMIQLVSALDLLGEHPAQVRESSAGAAEKLLGAQTFSFLDAIFKDTEADDGFNIPITNATNAPLNELLAAVTGMVYEHVGELFVPDTWPAIVTREAVFMFKGQTRFLQEQLDRLYNSDEMGPIGFYALARLLSQIQSPSTSAFAVRGMARLGTEHFQKDCQTLLHERTFLARTISNVLPQLNAMTPEELEALARVFPGLGITLQKAARAKTGNQPALETLRPLLNEAWETQWKEAMRTAFRHLIQTAPQ